MKKMEKFKEAIWIEVGSKRNTQFWNDVWCTYRPLKLEAPRIYEIAVYRDVKVVDCTNSDGRVGWHIPIRRNLND